MFDDSFIEKLPDNPFLAGKKICDEFMNYAKQPPGSKEEIYEEYLKAFALVQAFSQSHGIKLFAQPALSSNISDNMKAIAGYFYDIRGSFDTQFTVGTLEAYRKIFEQKFGKGFFYEFSDGDLQRIQTLINELRELISQTNDLGEDHKVRVLKRLEKLQSELHKRVSDLDKFWGLLVEGSIVLKKVGENAKPIVDRIREIADIVWRVQARAAELPSNAPLELPSGEDEE